MDAIVEFTRLFNCPVNGLPMAKPVSLSPCMHTIDRSAAEVLFGKKKEFVSGKTCPKCSKIVTAYKKDHQFNEIINYVFGDNGFLNKVKNMQSKLEQIHALSSQDLALIEKIDSQPTLTELLEPSYPDKKRVFSFESLYYTGQESFVCKEKDALFTSFEIKSHTAGRLKVEFDPLRSSLVFHYIQQLGCKELEFTEGNFTTTRKEDCIKLLKILYAKNIIEGGVGIDWTLKLFPHDNPSEKPAKM